VNQQFDTKMGVGTVSGDADATLRLIAGLPAPDGLEDRVKAGVRRRAAIRTGAVLDWPVGNRSDWAHNNWFRGAAAAAIVAIVAGGSWQVYSHVQPKQAQIALPRVGGSGGFASANAVRTPKTLDAPTVPHAAIPADGAAKKRAERKKEGQANAHPSVSPKAPR
jgi:hypothetical protein